MAPTADDGGYWLVASDGGIFAFNAPFYGSMGSVQLNRPIIGIVPSPTGHGYLMVGTDGGIFAFGDVPFHGSLGSTPPFSPITSVAVMPRTVTATITYAVTSTDTSADVTHETGAGTEQRTVSLPWTYTVPYPAPDFASLIASASDSPVTRISCSIKKNGVVIASATSSGYGSADCFPG